MRYVPHVHDFGKCECGERRPSAASEEKSMKRNTMELEVVRKLEHGVNNMPSTFGVG